MNVAIFNWRDLAHPRAGGAEFYTASVAQVLHQAGHTVTWFASRFPNSTATDRTDYCRILRAGNQITVRAHAAAWLWSHPEVDLIIDEVNTLPFLSPLLRPKDTVLLIHQLAREVWFLERPGFLGAIGYASEALSLRIYRDNPIVTISQSSAHSLREIGLQGKMDIIECSYEFDFEVKGTPVIGRLGYVGRITPSKRIDHLLRVIALLRVYDPVVHGVIIGGGEENEIRRLHALCHDLGISEHVRFLGPVPTERRDAEMAQFDICIMTSAREGWGRVVTECARFSVPAVVYPVSGLVDSVLDGETGFIAERASPQALATVAKRLIHDRRLRDKLGAAALSHARTFTFARFRDGWLRHLHERLRA